MNEVLKLNRRFALEVAERVPDGAGGHAENWTVLGTLWGQLKSGAGRERLTGGVALSAVSCRIIFRAAQAGSPQRPKPEQRLREGSRVYRILAVGDYDRAGRYVICHASEEVLS